MHGESILKPVRRRRAGLTMLEAAASLSLLGVLLAMFVPHFIRSVRVSKISEAADNLARLHQAAAAYYARPQRGATTPWLRGCLPESAGPTPSEPTLERTEADFRAATVPGRATWAALGFGQERVRYSYEVESHAPGCGPHPQLPQPTLRFRARGDLDGDGEQSSFERDAIVSSDGEELLPSGELRIQRRVE